MLEEQSVRGHRYIVRLYGWPGIAMRSCARVRPNDRVNAPMNALTAGLFMAL